MSTIPSVDSLASTRASARELPYSRIVSGSGEMPGYLEAGVGFPGEFIFSRFPALLEEWKNGVFHFPAVRPGTNRTWSLHSNAQLSPTGENLPALLMHLQSNMPDTWSQMQRIVASIVPDVGTLSLRTTGDQMEVGFIDPYVHGHRHNLKDLGTGVEQLLLTLAVGLAHSNARTIALEEPEMALHPAAQRAVLGLIHEWSKDRLFVVTTHSPVFLDQQFGSSMVYAVRRESGASTVSVANTGFAEVMRSLGVRLSDVLSADRILLVEGPSDRDVLGCWWPSLLTDPRVSVVTGQGGRNARFARLVESWLSHADQADRRKVLYLRDRDELNPTQLQRLESDQTVYVLRRREIENYLLDPKSLAAFFTLTGIEVSAAAVERVLQESAASLRDVVVQKAVIAQLDPFYYFDDITRKNLNKANSTIDALILSVLQRLPDADSVEKRMRAIWNETSKAVDDRWAEEWSVVVPGEELLDALFMRIMGRHFKKTTDAVAVAKLVDPPAELREVIDRFLVRDSMT
ncbi:AAA family ATPase [Catellatospora sp. NPDC049133]|uniref:AAA family ATPase n=1 Tax=Catellatospora sp. NPDC049133 TaxID=3155499 RepID=UPI003411AB9B